MTAKALPLLFGIDVESAPRGQGLDIDANNPQAPLKSLKKLKPPVDAPATARTVRKPKPKKKRVRPRKRNTDYQMARRACLSGSVTSWGPPANLLAQLNKWLHAGWSATALKASAWCTWRHPHATKVTASAYRYALCGSPDSIMALRFLEDFKANPSRYKDIR